MADRRQKKIGSGLPGNASFRQADLVDTYLLQWDGTLNRWTQVDPTSLSIAIGTDHLTDISNVGVNTHAVLDTGLAASTAHIADATLHFTEGSIDHGSILGLADDDHTQYSLVDASRDFTGSLTIDQPGTGQANLTVLNDEGGVQLRTDGATFSLYETGATGTVGQLWIRGQTGAGVFLYHAGVRVVLTNTDGIALRGSVANDPAAGGVQDTRLIFENTSGDDVGIIDWADTIDLNIHNKVHGGRIILKGEDTATGALLTLASFDPDGSANLYYNGTSRLLTTSTGGRSSGQTFDIDNTTVATLAHLRIRNNEGGLTLRADGDDMSIRQTDSSGNNEAVWLQGNNAGSLDLYYNGIIAGSTSLSGMTVYDTSGADPQIFAKDDAAANVWALQHAGTSLYLSHFVHGAPTIIRGEDAGGTTRNLFSADPDNKATLYYTGLAALESTAAGVDVLDTAGDDPILNLTDDANVTLFSVAHTGLTGTKIRTHANSDTLILQGTTSAAAVNDMITIDPDGRVSLGHMGTSLNWNAVATHAGGIKINAGPTLTAGLGTPEGSVSANVGSIFMRGNGGASTSIYVKESGSGNTGWVAK